MRLIATRVFDLDDQIFVVRLYAKGSSFALHETPEDVEDLGDGFGGWKIISLAEARQWLSEAPEQLVEVREAI